MDNSTKKKSSIFDGSITKLADILVPLSVFNKQVEIVEGLSGYSISVMRGSKDRPDDPIDITDDLYVVPYIFTSPLNGVLKEYCKTHPISSVTDRNYTLWKEEIDCRAVPYAKHAITMNTIKDLDANDYLTCILHLTSGLITIIDRNKVNDFMCIVLPDTLIKLPAFMHEFSEELHADDPQAMMNLRKIIFKIASCDDYRTFYAATPKDPADGVAIYSATDSRSMLLSLRHAMSATESIMDYWKAGRKIIITP